MRFIFGLFIWASLALWQAPAHAVDAQMFCYQGPTNPQWAPCTSTNPVPTVSTPAAGQGCTPYHLSGGTAASNNSTSVKPSAAGTVCRWTLISTSATLAYLKVYDSAGAPTCSSAAGLKHIYPIPSSTTGAGLQVLDAMGEAYVNGIGFCVTGGGGDTDNTNAPTGVYIEGSYK
jgi:hypothetical protein